MSNLNELFDCNKNKLIEILNTISDGIILTDNLIVEFWNKSATNKLIIIVSITWILLAILFAFVIVV